MNYLLVFIGGGLGSSLRHLINVVITRSLGTCVSLSHLHHQHHRLDRDGPDRGLSRVQGRGGAAWRLFLMTGILGGYTTFSAFSLDAALLYERGEIACAVLCAGIGAAFAGGPVRRTGAVPPSGLINGVTILHGLP
jgi:Integral membrane protein possibly involved in chromosome condensation